MIKNLLRARTTHHKRQAFIAQRVLIEVTDENLRKGMPGVYSHLDRTRPQWRQRIAKRTRNPPRDIEVIPLFLAIAREGTRFQNLEGHKVEQVNAEAEQGKPDLTWERVFGGGERKFIDIERDVLKLTTGEVVPFLPQSPKRPEETSPPSKIQQALTLKLAA
jgi:hypothetical protein